MTGALKYSFICSVLLLLLTIAAVGGVDVIRWHWTLRRSRPWVRIILNRCFVDGWGVVACVRDDLFSVLIVPVGSFIWTSVLRPTHFISIHHTETDSSLIPYSFRTLSDPVCSRGLSTQTQGNWPELSRGRPKPSFAGTLGIQNKSYRAHTRSNIVSHHTHAPQSLNEGGQKTCQIRGCKGHLCPSSLQPLS